jgi:glucose-1-phosphate adenylyltransferase
VRIGKNCHLKNCIIERECVIPDGMQIGINAEEDARRFRVSSSGEVVLVTPAMLKALLKAREAEA